MASTIIYSPLITKSGQGVATRLVKVLPDLTADGNIAVELKPIHLKTQQAARSNTLTSGTIHGQQPSTSVFSIAMPEDFDADESLTGSDNAETRCIRYRALSYVWGDALNTATIQVNFVKHLVRRNLFDFLTLARKTPELRRGWWWIDALCIDQANIPERNYQVKFMGQIFRNASIVLSWLGVNLEKSDIAIRIARSYHERVLQIRPPKFYLTAEQMERLLKKVCSQHSCSTYDFSAAFMPLVQSEYWNRAWISQEVQLASTIVLATGSNCLDLRAFLECMDAAEDFMGDYAAADFTRLLTKNVPKNVDQDMDVLIQNLSDTGTSHLVNILSTLTREQIRTTTMHNRGAYLTFGEAINLHCSDSKDRIYSQLSLVEHGQNFEVDYSEEKILLLFRTMLFCYSYEGWSMSHFEWGRQIVHGLDVTFNALSKVLMLGARPCGNDGIYQTLWTKLFETTISFRGETYASSKFALSPKGVTAVAERKVIHCPYCEHHFDCDTEVLLDRFFCLNFAQAHVSFAKQSDVGEILFVFHSDLENVSCRNVQSAVLLGQKGAFVSTSRDSEGDDQIHINAAVCMILIYLLERTAFSGSHLPKFPRCAMCSKSLEELLQQEKSGPLLTGSIFELNTVIHTETVAHKLQDFDAKCPYCQSKPLWKALTAPVSSCFGAIRKIANPLQLIYGQICRTVLRVFRLARNENSA